MKIMKANRKFNDKTYQYFNSYRLKSCAKTDADRQRAIGKSARITEEKGYYKKYFLWVKE
jgi:hypothetical protein